MISWWVRLGEVRSTRAPVGRRRRAKMTGRFEFSAKRHVIFFWRRPALVSKTTCCFAKWLGKTTCCTTDPEFYYYLKKNISIWHKIKFCATIVNIMYLPVIGHNMSNCQRLFYHPILDILKTKINAKIHTGNWIILSTIVLLDRMLRPMKGFCWTLWATQFHPSYR